MAYYNTIPTDVNAKVRRWAEKELTNGTVPDQDLIEHCIREYGEQTAEWFESSDQKPVHHWRDYYDEHRDLLSEYVPPNRNKIIVNETQTVDIYEDAIEELDSHIKSIDRGIGDDPRKIFISALLLTNREQIAEDVESGEIESFEVEA